MALESGGDRRQDLEAQLIERAARDAAFREELVRDPKAAVARELSAATGGTVQFPASVTIVVHEETPDTFHLVLPATPAQPHELSDAELASVAGGTDKNPFLTFTCPPGMG